MEAKAQFQGKIEAVTKGTKQDCLNDHGTSLEVQFAKRLASCAMDLDVEQRFVIKFVVLRVGGKWSK
jgi:hypothetical protein